MSTPELHAYRNEAHDAAIVLVHGFGGSAKKTFAQFPEYLVKEPRLDGWDIYNLGYSTGLAPDVLRRIWSADPDIGELARFLNTRCAHDLRDYEALVIVAHSMGGLVTQRALVDDAALARRVRHVFLFGTPSGGLHKAARFSIWKAQLADMAHDGEFIAELRDQWQTRFTDPEFCLWLVAGDKDEFVPDDSSLAPFPDGNETGLCEPGSRIQKRVIAGNHLEIVKPSETGTGSLPIQIVVDGLAGGTAAGGPANAAPRRRHRRSRACGRPPRRPER